MRRLVGILWLTTGLSISSKSTVYRLVSAGQFPRPVKLGTRAVAWRSSEIDAWIEGLEPIRYAHDTPTIRAGEHVNPHGSPRADNVP